MDPHPTTGVDDSNPPLDIVPWESFETHRASAFEIAGGLTIASFIVPVGISALTDWAWASGILLIGFAVIGVAVGLFGLYPQTNEGAPRLAFTGVLFAGIAAIAALILIVSTGIILLFGLGTVTSSSMTVEIFLLGALSMAGGFSLGFLLFGIAGRRVSTISSRVCHLLVGGGLLLLLPVVVETLGFVTNVSTPAWILFPILGVMAIDMLAIGHLLPQGGTEEAC